ncbi:MAG: DUF1588 domain-containing protein [Lentisphaeraceae bacterium]|nr:DUF1588 domain-containing protein [Lentisphaeraceae bacterium]
MKRKLACCFCSNKIYADATLPPFATINCEVCNGANKVPLIIDHLVVTEEIDKKEHYSTYLGYDQNSHDQLIVKIFDEESLGESKRTKITSHLKSVNEFINGYSFIETKNRTIITRPLFSTAMYNYLQEKQLTAVKALSLIKALAQKLKKAAKSNVFPTTLTLKNIFIDDLGELIISDVIAPNCDVSQIELSDSIDSFSKCVFELVCLKSEANQQHSPVFNLRDETPYEFKVFILKLFSAQQSYRSFNEIIQDLANINLSILSEPKQEKEKPEKAPSKKINKKKVKSKVAFRKLRQKQSSKVAVLVFIIILCVSIFSLYKYKELIFPEKVEVVKVSEKPVKILKRKIKQKEKKVEVPQLKFTDIKLKPQTNVKGDLEILSFKEILTTKCIDCHGQKPDKIEGKFNLKKLLASKSNNAKYWKKLYDSVKSHDMPPEDSESLTEDESLVILSHSQKFASETDQTAAARCLTPVEITNTMSDLFSLDQEIYNPFKKLYSNYHGKEFYTAQKNIITPYYIDDLYEAVDNVLKSYVSLSPQTDPLHLETKSPGTIHLQEVNGASRDLRWGRKPENFVQLQFKNLNPEKKRKNEIVENEEILAQVNKLSLPPGTYKLSFDAQVLNLNKPIDPYKYGQEVVDIYKGLKAKHSYSLPVSFYELPPSQADAYAKTKFIKNLEIYSDKMTRHTVEFTLKRRNGIGYQFPTGLIPDDHRLSRMITAHRFKKGFGLKEIEDTYQNYLRKKEYDLPMVRFKNFLIEGPFDVDVSEYSVHENERLNNYTIRKKFRALHKKNSIKMNMPFDYIFDKFKQKQIAQEKAYRNTLLAFFMSPEFLTLKYSQKDQLEKIRLLSYSIHKTYPNVEFVEKFMEVKDASKLSTFSDWLVSHEHFERFIKSFSVQWLELSNIQTAMPDERSFSEYYDNQLLHSFKEEAFNFLLYLFREDRPISELVNADYSFLDKKLESFYNARSDNDIDGFQKVKLKDSQRGGILTMGAFLTATGNGVDPLPIKRSEWILKNILNTELPPPPDDIDLENFQQDLSAPFAKRLKVHSQNEKCYSCHKKIDPIAVIMNRFNTIGRLNYEQASIDLNGKQINAPKGLKSYLATQDELIAKAFSESLIRFIMGRDINFQDQAKIEKILNESESGNYPIKKLFSSIIKYYLM